VRVKENILREAQAGVLVHQQFTAVDGVDNFAHSEFVNV